MSDCIFCKIIQKTIPADIVYESDSILSFRDINPIGPTHILVIPKKHIPSFDNIQAKDFPLLQEMLLTVQKLAKKEGIDSSGYRVITNINADAGQEVFHMHIHLIGGKRLGKMG